MSLDADHIVDRRRMRRKLTFWRAFAVLIAAAAVIGGGVFLTGARSGLSQPSASIARIQIEGLIRANQQRTEALRRLGDSNARAVIVRINSPGGTVAGSEQLHEALVRLKAKKPVVVVIDGLAASGGYIAAMAADHIVAQQSSIVGSIGVIFQYPNFHQLLQKIGVDVESIKSSPLKASPNGLEPTSAEAKAAVASLVADSYGWFKGLVQERRAMDAATLVKVSDGRVFTAAQALPLKLIDEIGDEQTAREWLAKNKGVAADLKVRDWRTGRAGSEFRWLGAAASLFELAGFPSLASAVSNDSVLRAAASAQLDGLLALWHPELRN